MSEKITIEQEVEGFAKLAFSIHEVAVIVGVQVNTIYSNEKLLNAYNRGSLLGKAELRKQIQEACNNGSSVAQALLVKLFDKQKIDDADF